LGLGGPRGNISPALRPKFHIQRKGEKRMKKAAPLLILFFLLVFAVSASAGPVIDGVLKRGELIVGTSGDYPPFTATAKEGRLIGYDVDLANVIASAMGVKAKVVKMPFGDLLTALEAGKIDMVISCLTIMPKRNLKVAFAGPYFLSGQSILTTRETAFKATKLADMNKAGFSLAVPGGTTSEIIAKQSISDAKIVVAKDMDEALQLLLTGKVQAVMSDVATCAVAAFRNQDKGLMSTDRLTFEPIGIAVSQTDPLLVNWLNNFILVMKGNGDLDELGQKWFKDSWWIKMLP
jgi:polar amino acid transport system substrate-binding protein